MNRLKIARRSLSPVISRVLETMSPSRMYQPSVTGSLRKVSVSSPQMSPTKRKIHEWRVLIPFSSGETLGYGPLLCSIHKTLWKGKAACALASITIRARGSFVSGAYQLGALASGIPNHPATHTFCL